MDERELKHYGVLGMKWGLRRHLRKNNRIRKKAFRTWLPFDNINAKNFKTLLTSHPQLFSKAYVNDILKSSGKNSIEEINKRDLKKGKVFADRLMADTWNEISNTVSTRYDKRYYDD